MYQVPDHLMMTIMSFSKSLSLREWGQQPTEGCVRQISRPVEARVPAAQSREHSEMKCFFLRICVRLPAQHCLGARNGPRNAALLVRVSAHTRSSSSRASLLVSCGIMIVAQRAQRRGGATGRAKIKCFLLRVPGVRETLLGPRTGS